MDAIERCADCARQFICGSCGEACDIPGCTERVLARRYESPEDAREGVELGDPVAAPRFRDEAPA
jgi:hypothetical protein